MKQRWLGEMGSPPGDGIKDTCKRENKRPTPPHPPSLLQTKANLGISSTHVKHKPS